MQNFNSISVYDWNMIIEKAYKTHKNKQEEIRYFGYCSPICAAIENLILSFKNGDRSRKLYEEFQRILNC